MTTIKIIHYNIIIHYLDLAIDECSLELDQCHPVASCTNTRGSYSCTCPPGSSGNGFNCTGTIIPMKSKEHVSFILVHV